MKEKDVERTIVFVGALATVCITVVSVVAIVRGADWAATGIVVGVVCATICAIIPVTRAISLKLHGKSPNSTTLDVGISTHERVTREDAKGSTDVETDPTKPSAAHDSLPQGDDARLIVINIVFKPLAERYQASDDRGKAAVLDEAIAEHGDLRLVWKMPEKVFRFYMIVCLEEERIIHKHEFLDPQQMVKFVRRHLEYKNDIATWLVANVAGTDISDS